jgi:hypothetical protein
MHKGQLLHDNLYLLFVLYCALSLTIEFFGIRVEISSD